MCVAGTVRGDDHFERNWMATDVKGSTFEQEVLQSETPVLVDFWAEWCGPCHAVSPVLDKIADERQGQLKLVKVNIDENQNLALKYGIQSIPAMVLFKNGQPAAAAIGAQPKPALERAPRAQVDSRRPRSDRGRRAVFSYARARPHPRWGELPPPLANDDTDAE